MITMLCAIWIPSILCGTLLICFGCVQIDRSWWYSNWITRLKWFYKSTSICLLAKFTLTMRLFLRIHLVCLFVSHLPRGFSDSGKSHGMLCLCFLQSNYIPCNDVCLSFNEGLPKAYCKPTIAPPLTRIAHVWPSTHDMIKTCCYRLICFGEFSM